MSCLIGGYVACPLNNQFEKDRLSKIIDFLKPSIILDKKSMVKTDFEADISNSNELKNNDFLIIFTSGTTGNPKGILFETESFLKSAQSFASIAEYNENTIVYHCLPMFYMAGILNTFFSCIFSNSKVILAEKVTIFNIINLINNSYKLKPNSITLTPSIYQSLMLNDKNSKSIIDHFKDYQSIISTASYLYPEIQEKFYTMYKKRIQSCYGLTELGGPLTIQSWEDTFEESNVGRNHKDVKIKIFQSNNVNNIYIKTPFSMKGTITSEGFQKLFTDKNGFFNTGDIGDYKNGILFIKGRSKDIVKKGGEILSLNFIENIALKNLNVSECAAVGKDDKLMGERIILFIKFNQINIIQEDIINLNDHLKKYLRPIEMPSKIIPVPIIPKTSNNKPSKKTLLELYNF